MAKKIKYEYSKTAKERKQDNRPDSSNAVADSITDDSIKTKRSNTKLFVLIAGIFLAVVLISFAIAIPFMTSPSFAVDTPVARIELVVNGRRENLYIQLLPDAAPATVSNFMFLARYGYFDDTIISDVSGPQTPVRDGHGFVRFGGYETPNQSRRIRETNDRFYDRFPLLRDDREGNKLGWELRSENQVGVTTQFNVSMITGWQHSTLFQIAALSNPHTTVESNNPNSPGTRTTPGNVFGTVMGRESRELVQRIANTAPNPNSTHSHFNEPISQITIRRVRLFQEREWRMTADRFRTEVIQDPTRFSNWREQP